MKKRLNYDNWPAAFKTGFYTWAAGLIFGFLETAYFGWNWKAQSHNEAVCDQIHAAMTIVGCLLMLWSRIFTGSVTYRLKNAWRLLFSKNYMLYHTTRKGCMNIRVSMLSVVEARAISKGLTEIANEAEAQENAVDEVNRILRN